MIARLIGFCIQNKFLVFLFAFLVFAGGIFSIYSIRLDAIPDLSDVQVIIFTEFPGQAPQVVEDQVTYPLTTAMFAVPYAKVVRGYSFFGFSFVYIIFEDGTDLYWARSRVLEYLNFARGRLPPGVTPSLGPDATGVGWVFQYSLVNGWYCPDHPKGMWRDDEQDRWYHDRDAAPERRRSFLRRVRIFDAPGKCPLDGKKDLLHAEYDLSELRSLQDWYIRCELTAVPGISEVASIGGFVRQYQVVADLRKIALGATSTGTPIQLGDVAAVQVGPELRRGIAERNGEGEVACGIVVMRFGENALEVIERAKAKVHDLDDGLPDGVAIRLVAGIPVLLLAIWAFVLPKDLSSRTILWLSDHWFVVGLGWIAFAIVLLLPQRILTEEKNPLSKLLIKLYEPPFRLCLKGKWLTLAVAVGVMLSMIYPLSKLGSEFMPPLQEGDLLYMPTTDPGVSVTKAREIFQQTDKLIATFPEVENVFGKIGRSETATDPAPLSMIETTITLHRDESKWRTRRARTFFGLSSEGRPITVDELTYGWNGEDGTWHPGLNDVVKFPGLTNAWTMPIKTRIDMLSTGIKTPVGIKIMGENLGVLADLAGRISTEVMTIPGTVSAYPEKTVGGNYVDFDIDRDEVARYGLTVGDVQDVIMSATSGPRHGSRRRLMPAGGAAPFASRG